MTASHKYSSSSSDPFTQVRIPLMISLLGVAMGNYVLQLPAWVLLVVFGAMGGAWSLFHERRLLLELMTAWRTPMVVVAPIVGGVLYGIVEVLLQLVADLALGDGVLQQGELPVVFEWLLRLRAQADGLSPIVAGLVGGIGVGIVEEIFWRGFVFTRLMLLWRHSVAVLLGVALYMVYYFFALGPLAAMVAGFLGMVLALVTYKTRSLVPAMLIHMVFLLLVLWIRPDVAAWLLT